ncbi:hypothetical protein [Vagococcus hydrophili]|uniref:Uncharacterized protein n=1 Tax=Vagococcus hydrophili TaxID=2714947 RepID=A0A6G8AVD1_9ENTE|nr:hypothetical protein [Vagococcus hydrophili]QIL48912.1 hypothetical protein G7082_10550 [Vagococcus hydrophili]
MEVVENLYKELKKEKSDYVLIGEEAEIIKGLTKYCQTDKDRLFWFLGGPLLWIFEGRANKRRYEENNVSKTERKIVYILSRYEVTFKNDYCVLVRKNININ